MKALIAKIASVFFLVGAVSCAPNKPFPVYSPSPDEKARQACHDKEKSDDLDAASNCFLVLCASEPVDDRACYERTKVLFKSGNVDEARVASLDFVRRFPQNALAQAALKRLVRSYSESGDIESGIEVLQKLEEATKDTEIRDTLMFETASLCREAGRADDEKRILLKLVSTYGRFESQLFDNAMWRLIEIARESKNTEEEIALIKRFLDTYESSWFLASYASPYHDDALLRLGYISLESKDYKKAIRIFKKLSNNKTSRLRDDSLLGGAKANLALGRAKKACKLLKKINEIKDADYKRQALDLISLTGCSE